MYADYEYYSTEYGGKMSADDYKRFGRRADSKLNRLTGKKLQFAFPTDEEDVRSVKDCVCEMADFLHQIDLFVQMSMESMGTVTQADGTVKGKVVTSISSGSESIGYSVGGNFDLTDISQSAKDRGKREENEYKIAHSHIGGVPDANGVNLLYAGAYPGKREVWK